MQSRIINNKNMSQANLDFIAEYMDDEIRELVHGDYCGKSPFEFFRAYCKKDKGFKRKLISLGFEIII